MKPNDGQEDDVAVHGTGILAKVVGWKHGVARRSKPVIVRGQDPGGWSMAGWCKKGLRRLAAHIQSKYM